MENTALKQKALKLVKARIVGTRKGCNEPASEHSIRVAESLKKYGYSEEVVIAGLLHDSIEDGGMTAQELLNLGFSQRVVSLVDACSHDSSMQNKDARWTKMIARLIDIDDKDAWAIKIADVKDNYRGCQTMPADRAHFIRTVKAPLILATTRHLFNELGIWQELNQEVK